MYKIDFSYGEIKTDILMFTAALCRGLEEIVIAFLRRDTRLNIAFCHSGAVQSCTKLCIAFKRQKNQNTLKIDHVYQKKCYKIETF